MLGDMAEEEFEIDIYGDTGESGDGSKRAHDGYGYEAESYDMNEDRPPAADQPMSQSNVDFEGQASTELPPHGVKRKIETDDRPVDPGATTALTISDLHWWSTDDDIRGWAKRANCVAELKDITFNEHKVNGKSKG
jgi:hypothetical protein